MRQAMTPFGLGSIALIGALSLAACTGSPSSSLGPNGPTGVTAAGSASFGPNGEEPPVCAPPNVLNDKGECVPPPPPPPPGAQGCTPGYWKANVKKGASEWTTPFAPAALVGTVFVAGAYNSSTLLQALEFGGGAGVSGATQNLLRAAVAAVLNAASAGVEYPRSSASIVTAVNAAIASGDRATILALASALDADNNLGCSLDNSSN